MLILPFSDSETVLILGRKNSKSLCIFVFGLGKLDTEAPVPSYCLDLKSKENPVISSMVSILEDAPAMSSTLGLKS